MKRLSLTMALPGCMILLATAGPASSFEQSAKKGEAKKCTECHSLTAAEAQEIVKGFVERVIEVRPSEIPGFWEVDVEKGPKKFPVFVDFTKKYLISGDVIRIDARESLTQERFIELNRVDFSVIPLEDAIVIGDPKAPNKIAVFDDPECPFCQKLHPEMKKVVSERPDVAFFIKLIPLKIHPNARNKAKAILCARSPQMLEDSLAGKPIPEPTCETDQVEKNEAVAQQLGIGSTPTLVFSDGRVVPGYKPADKILKYLSETAPGAAKGKK